MIEESTRVRIFKAIGVWLPADPETIADAIEKALLKANSTPPPRTYEQGAEDAAALVGSWAMVEGNLGNEETHLLLLRLEEDIRALPTQPEGGGE